MSEFLHALFLVGTMTAVMYLVGRPLEARTNYIVSTVDTALWSWQQ